MKLNLAEQIRSVWSSTSYDTPELTQFARNKSVVEARHGLVAMSILTIVILAIEAMLYVKFELNPIYLYTCGILVLLSLNMIFSARTVEDPGALHLLGATLLVVSGCAFVLLAHYQHAFHPMLFASVAILFFIIPMMSWGLREALVVTILIYAMFTLSTLDADYSFARQSLWSLQFIMLAASAVSLSLVVRNVRLRKHDVSTQHDLILAQERITHLSNLDPLTGAWNRRFFDQEFDFFLQRCQSQKIQFNFMLLDVDDFKQINDVCGHDCGDSVLKNIGKVFLQVIGNGGYLVRIGGDEFVVIFADLDPGAVAADALKRFNELNASSDFSEVSAAKVSIGVASVPPQIEVSYRQLYKQADIALYRAKALKDGNTSSLNIVISVLNDFEDMTSSTQTLWKIRGTEKAVH